MTEKKCLQSFGRKPEEGKPFVRTKCRWEYRYIIEMFFTEMGGGRCGLDSSGSGCGAMSGFLFCALLYDAIVTKLYSAEWLVNDELEMIRKEAAYTVTEFAWRG
jgi:hypothetical protein